jgi:hypothetical protein
MSNITLEGQVDAFGHAPRAVARIAVTVTASEIERIQRLAYIVKTEAQLSDKSCAMTTEMDASVHVAYFDEDGDSCEELVQPFALSDCSWCVETEVIELRIANEAGDRLIANFPVMHFSFCKSR